MKLHLPVKLRASLLAAVVAVPALLYNMAYAGTTYSAPSNEYGWDTNDITLNQRYLQTSGNIYVADVKTYTPYEMYGDTDPGSVNAKVRVGYLPDDTGYTNPLVYRNGQYGTVDGSGVFTPVADQSTVVFKATGPETTNTASIIVKADTPTDGKYVSFMDGNGTFDSQEMVFTNSVQSGVNPQVGGTYQGNVNIDTDAIRVTGSDSQVVLEDVDIQDHDASGTVMTGEIEHGSQIVILDGNDNLTDEEKQLLNIAGVQNNNVYSNDTPRTVELGAVTGTSAVAGQAGGSLVVVGNKERTEAMTDENGKITQGAFVEAATKDDHLDVIITSVENLSEFGAANADLDISGDVRQVVTLNLVNSTTEVGGNVGATGIHVNGESTLQAVGDIKNINYQGASSTNIAGKVASSKGEISLTNGSITEGAIVAATDANNGDVTLSNIAANEAERLEAGHDMTFTTDTTVSGVDDILIGNDLVVKDNSHVTDKEGDLVAPGDIIVNGDSSITDINGNVEAGDGIAVTNGEISDITGNVEAGKEGITVTDGEISNIGGDVISGGDLTLDNGDLTDIVGTVDVEGDMSATDGSVVENLGGLDVEGGLTVDGSSVTNVANGADAVGELGDDLLVQNKGDVHNVTLDVDGDIIVDDSILGSSTLSATGKLEAKNGAILRKEEVEDEEGNKVWRDNVIAVAMDSSILSGSQVSGTDLTVTSETGDPNLEIKGTGTVVTADSNLVVDGTVTVDDSAELSLNGGEQMDASLSADNLVLGMLKDDKASISKGTVDVRVQTSITAGDTLELSDADGSLGAVVETGASTGDDGTTLDIKDGSVIGAASVGTDATDAGKSGLDEYFDHVNVNGDSTLTVDGSAAVVDYNQGGVDTQGSKTTIGGDAWLVDADITGAGTYNAEQGTETTINGNAHIGSLSMTNEGALSVVGAANDAKVSGYIADLDQASDGHINAVNATLTTPELNGENISLGLNGGTVVLDQVSAADGATVASTAATNAHVLVGEITNASAAGAPDQTPYGQSTIQTTVDRVTSEYSFSQGEAATAPCKSYVFIAKQDGSVEVNGQTINFTAGQEVTIADTYLNTETDFGTEGGVVTGVSSIDMDAFIAQNQDTLSPKLVAVVDAEGNPVLDGQGNPLMAQVTQDSLLTYYPEASQTLGSLETKTDGVASLTVVEDFDADNTIVNAYRTGTADADGHVTADADTGFIDIQGVLSGQDNKLTADAGVTINGIVSKEGAEHQANNTVVSQQGDIEIGEEGIVGSGNQLTSEEGSITVTGDTAGNGNTLAAEVNVTTEAITGSGNTLSAQTGYIETGDITGDRNDLDAELNITTEAITGDRNALDSVAGSIVTADIEGDSNDLNAQLNITTGAITGNVNTLDAVEGAIEVTGKLTGDSNALTALDETSGSITTQDIEGSQNQLQAGTSIDTGAITGDANTLAANTSYIKVDGAITGNSNDLDAATTIATGDITGSENTLDAVGNITTGAITGDAEQNLKGNDNVLTSTEGSISTGEIEGDSNELKAYVDIVTDGSITGDENTLTAETGSIQVNGDVAGDENTLLAENSSITVDGDIEGSWNELSAGTSIAVGDITGSSNTLTAGTSIEAGQITGDWNELTAGTTVSTASVTGNLNTISGVEGASVNGDVTGEDNVVSSENGEVVITGTLDGSNNSAIAGGVVHVGTVAGQNQWVSSYGKGLAPDDTAIIVDTFRAQGSSVGIETVTGEFGTPTGNGAIIIGTMSAVDGELDAALRNSIVSNVSSIYIGEMDGFNAYTTVKAAKDIVVGNSEMTHLPTGEEPDIAYNQEFVTGRDFLVNKENGLKLVNSTITAQGAIKGSSLTLELDDSVRYDVSHAGSVALESLTLSGGAQLDVSGKAVIGSLTLEGQFSALNATTTDITALTLRNGASYNAGLVLVEELTIDNSSMGVVTLADVKELTLVNNATLAITGVDGKTDLTGDLSVNDGSKLQVTMDLATTQSITANTGALIEGRNVTAGTSIAATGGSIEATGGSIIAGTGITAGNGTLTARDKIIAQAGSITASGASVLTAGKGVEATAGMTLSDASVVNADVTLTGGDAVMTGSTKVDGSLKLSGGNVTMTGTNTTDAKVTGSISGAANATLTNATVGNLDATGAVILSNANTGWIKGHSLTASKGSIVTGDVTLTGGEVNLDATKVEGDLIGASAVTLTGSSIVKNIVNATGDVDLTDSQAKDISTSANVDLTGSSAGTISGVNVTLDGGSSSGAITATGTAKVDASTVDGGISGANRVELTSEASVTGNVTMAADNSGVLLDSAELAGSIIGANGATVQAGSLVTGDLGLISGNALVSASTIHGNITGAANVTVNQGSTVGNIENASGKVDLDQSTASSISTTGDVDLTASHADTISGANVKLEGNSSSGSIKASGTTTVTDSIVGGSIESGEKVDLTNATAGNISSGSTVDLTGSHAGTISGTDVKLDGNSSSGAITATGTATVDGSTVEGTISGTDVSVIGGSTSGAITASGTATVTGSTVNGAIDAEGNATVTGSTVAGTISGADVSLTGGSSSGAITASGTATVTGSTVAGTITAAGKVDLDNATAGDISSAAGDVDLTNSHVGTVEGNNVMLEGGSSSGAITASGTAIVDGSTVEGSISGTDVSVTGGSTSGAITATGTATVTGSTIDGAIDAEGNATVTGSAVEGTVSGADVSVTGGSSSGAITATGTATVDGSTVEGTVSGTDVSVIGGSTSGAITATGTATVEGSTVDGNVSGTDVKLTDSEVDDIIASGDVNLSNADTGSISGATSVEMTAGTVVNGDVTMAEVNEGVTMDSSTVIGSIHGSNSLEIKNQSTVTGDVTLTGDGDLSIDDSTVHGTVSGAQSITLTNTSTGDVSVTGSVTLDNADTGSISGHSLTSSNGSTVTGDVTLTGGNAELADTTVTGSISGATDATLTGSTTGDVTVSGSLTLDDADTGSLTGHSLTSSNGSTVTGDVTLTGGNAELADTTVTGSITGSADASVTGGSVTGAVAASGSVTLTGTTTGAVSGALLNASDSDIKGGVTLTGGDATLDNTDVAGNLTGAANVTMTEGTVGSISATGSVSLTDVSSTGTVDTDGSVTLNDADTGSITGESLVASNGSTVTGDVTLAGGNATVTDSTVTGAITGAADVEISKGTAGSVTATGDVTLTDTTAAVGSVTTDASVTLNNAQSGSISGESLDANHGSTVTGDVTLAGGNATVTDSTVTGAITGAADVEIAKGTAGSVTATGDVTLTDTTAAVGSVTTDASVTLNNAQSGSLVAESLAADAGSIIDGDVTLSGGDAVVTGESLVTGSITGADGVTVTKSTTGDITGATGDVELLDATVGTVETAGAVLASGTVKSTGSVTSSGLSVAEFGALTAKDDVTAAGLIDLDGSLTSTEGNISLTGTGASSIDADVTAKKTVTLGGTLAAQNSAVTAQNIVVNGTLNAGEGTLLNGTVAGTGTINKTGGDELVLGADTNMAGGAVNVADESTLMAEGGHLGDLTVAEGSTLVVGGDSKTAIELKADSLTMDADSKLQSTLNLAAGKADKVTVAGAVDLKGATLVLDQTKTDEEAAIADGTRHTVVGCTVTSGLSEDVEHSMETLNAHVENFDDHIDLVLSKNYKGATKTWNQKQVADALSSIDPDSVQGTQMGEVLDALAHTRSEADAVAALDSLGGAGLAAMQKVIAEESREHMQTLRDTLTGLNTGIARRIAEDGSIIPGVNSNAVTASITGGTSNVSGDENVGDYSRSSLGFMLAGAHAINSKWSFGGGFAYSSSTASCDSVDIDSDAFYFDVALMHNSGRFHQMGTLGAGFYGFDTTRSLRVNAPGHDYAGTADGSTSATAINLSYEAAYDLIISKDGHHTFSPVVMAEATFAQIKGMTESGAGNAGLRSEMDDVQSLTVGGGARYTYSFGGEKNPGFVSAEALVLGTAGDDTMKVRNTFIANGTSFELNGPKAGGVGLRLNVNALIPIDDQWSIIGNVASEFRSDQSAVSGSVGVKYSF